MSEEADKSTVLDEVKKTGCKLDTDGDRNCPAHPAGCPETPVPETPASAGTVVIPGDVDRTKPRFVIKIMTYIDERERRIQEKQFVAGELPAGMCTFTGAGIMQFPNPEDPDKPLKQISNFDIPGAMTFQEAFGLFDTYWKQKLMQEGAESGFPEPHPTQFIVRVDQMMDNNLQHVQAHVCIVGELPPKYARYRGVGITVLPNKQELKEEFVLDGAETILDAFKIYPGIQAETARRTGEQYRQWAEAKHREMLKAAQRANAKPEKKIIVPEDKTGKNGPLGAKKSSIIIPGQS